MTREESTRIVRHRWAQPQARNSRPIFVEDISSGLSCQLVFQLFTGDRAQNKSYGGCDRSLSPWPSLVGRSAGAADAVGTGCRREYESSQNSILPTARCSALPSAKHDKRRIAKDLLPIGVVPGNPFGTRETVNEPPDRSGSRIARIGDVG